MSTQKGYGFVLIILFVVSSMLIGTSLFMILAPGTVGYVSSMGSSSARQVALAGLGAAQTDMMSKMASGTTITTAYRYPSSGSNTISMPTYPGSGGSASVGTYYVTASKARGFTYLLKSTATVNGATTVVSKLVQLNVTPSVAAFTAYSLRKLVSGYMGSAVRVRCAYAGTTTDIGFTAAGDFDMSALRNCLGDGTLPLERVAGAKMAYGLRKLSSAYNGYAIKVRSSAAGNPTQDIGFDSNGSLDIVALKSFIGGNSGYIDTWYDQSGNNKNISQTTLGKQPVIATAGVINTQNNTPSIQFSSGANTHLISSSTISGYLNTASATSFVVGEVQDTSPDEGRIVVLQKTGDDPDYFAPTSMQILAQAYSYTDRLMNHSNGEGSEKSQPANTLFQATTVKSGGASIVLYVNDAAGYTVSSGGNSRNTINPDYLVVGAGRNNSTVLNSFDGYVNELIIYNTSSINSTNRKLIQNSQGHYYNIAAFRDGFVTTWYDQSGNGLNLTQGTNNLQPSVDMSGVRPAVYFQGTQGQYMDNTLANQTTALISGFTVAQINDYYNTPASIPTHGRIVSVGKTGDALDWGNTTSTALLHKNNQNFGNARNSDLLLTYSTSSYKDFQASTIFNGTNRTCRQEQGGTTYTNSTTSDATGNLVINRIRIGAPMNNGPAAHEYWSGRINEVLMNVVSVTSNQYQNIEDDQQAYHQLQ